MFGRLAHFLLGVERHIDEAVSGAHAFDFDRTVIVSAAALIHVGQRAKVIVGLSVITRPAPFCTWQQQQKKIE